VEDANEWRGGEGVMQQKSPLVRVRRSFLACPPHNGRSGRCPSEAIGWMGAEALAQLDYTG